MKKNQYIKLLKIDFPIIKKFLAHVKAYRLQTILLSYMLFSGGGLHGIKVETMLFEVVVNIFDYAIDMNYIEKALDVKKFLNLSSEAATFNMLALCVSCSFCITILFVILIFYLWHKFLKSTKLLIPKIDDPRLEVVSWWVYSSFWYFIGLVFGLNMTIFFYSAAILSKLSIIGNNLLFNNVRFDLIDTNLLYPRFHLTVYLIGLMGSTLLIYGIYYNGIKPFSDRAIELITDYYNHDFPYIKIKTEAGEVKGQLKDIRNKSLVTLSDKNELKIVPWDKIEILEASNPNETEVKGKAKE